MQTQQSSPNLIQHTDYNLQTLSLYSSGVGKSIDLMPYFIELNLFEDLYNTTISGNVVISDAIGILNLTGLNGTEFITVVLSKTSTDTPISRIFRVFSASDRVIGINNNNESYVINFCSEEFIVSQQYRICKPYVSKQISDIITDILNNFLLLKNPKTKKISIEKTYGQYDFVLPNKKIFETINWLSTYARPASGNPGADMLFFENLWGYNFSSLQTLFTQTPNFEYFFNPKNLVVSNMDQKFFNVIKLEILNYVDVLDAVEKGSFTNRLITIDPLLRKKYVTDFNYDDNFKKSKHLNKFPLTNNYKNRYGSYNFDTPPTNIGGLETGTLRLAASNSNQFNNPYIKSIPGSVAHDIFIETYVPNRVAQIALANYNRLRITVPGNSQLTVGMTLSLNVFGISDTSNSKATKNQDSYFSGKYLVTAVRHLVTMVENSRAYITVVEIAKESVVNPYPGVNNNDTIMNQLVTGIQV